jgi:(S)-ureidoglycine aminohydrolase
MNPVGMSRSRVCRDHALIAPDSFVRTALPGWDRTQGVILISPQMGARFTLYMALMAQGGIDGAPLSGVERMFTVLEGAVELQTETNETHSLKTGGFAYIPPDHPVRLRATSTSCLSVFEKRYIPLPGVAAPGLRVGQEQDVEGENFMGDPDAVLKTLLPQDPSFDMAVNIFSYKPGATLPMVEVHVMEHGLVMLEGQGVYRLADSWYPVQAGDVIWMAPYCAQWFVASGKSPARYLYYKDMNRDPLEGFA